MKPIKVKPIVMKMPMPSSRAVKAGQAQFGAFAHHPPVLGAVNPRFERPKGGKGPRN